MSSSLLAAAGFALIAMIVRGLTGFGAALVLTPLLFLLFEPKTAILAGAVVQCLTGLSMTYQVHREVDRTYLKQIVPACLIGIALGALVFINFDSSLLKRWLGALTALFALRTMWMLVRPARDSIRWPRAIGYYAAFASGFISSLFGIGGPPIVIFLENQLTSKAVLRATLVVYFFIMDGTRVAGYLVANLLDANVLLISAAMTPGALLGIYLGSRLHLRISERLFRWCVSIVLLCTGMLLIVN